MTLDHNFLTKSYYVICLFFWDSKSMAHTIFEFGVTKWPPNDLKCPTVTCKQNFLTKSHYGACYGSFHGFLECWVNCADLNLKRNDLQRPSKWPQLTYSDFGTCYMSFYSFCWDAESIALIRFELNVTKWPPNDLKWPIVNWKYNFSNKSHFGTCYVFS